MKPERGGRALHGAELGEQGGGLTQGLGSSGGDLGEGGASDRGGKLDSQLVEGGLGRRGLGGVWALVKGLDRWAELCLETRPE